MPPQPSPGMPANFLNDGAILTHLPETKWSPFWQTIISNAFLWMQGIEFQFHWVQLTINQQWFRQWLDAEQATSHYLNQRWLISLTYICGIRGRWDIHKLRGFESLPDINMRVVSDTKTAQRFFSRRKRLMVLHKIHSVGGLLITRESTKVWH